MSVVKLLVLLICGLCQGNIYLAGGTGYCSAADSADCTESAYNEPLIDCHPDPEPSEDICTNRGCIWQSGDTRNGPPKCTFPAGYGYKLLSEPQITDSSIVFKLQRVLNPTLFGSDVKEVDLRVEYQSDYRLRLKFYDPNSERYEVPLTTYDSGKGTSQLSRLYDVTWVREPQFGIKIIRRSTDTVVFDTGLPGFVFSDQFLQISTRLSSDIVYGFGEHNHQRLRHDMKWRRWVMFSKDISVQHDQNLYGVQPFYQSLEEDGNAHGVFFKNSNAMEVVLQPNPHPAITFRTIGGVLDFYIYLGPTPERVVQQHTEAVGRPLMPPYWALGFMLSRWGYNSSDVLSDVIRRNRDAGLPMDVQFGDIDYMYQELDFTYDRKLFQGLPDIVSDLHKHQQKFIAIVVRTELSRLLNREVPRRITMTSEGMSGNMSRGFSSCWTSARKMVLELQKNETDSIILVDEDEPTKTQMRFRGNMTPKTPNVHGRKATNGKSLGRPESKEGNDPMATPTVLGHSPTNLRGARDELSVHRKKPPTQKKESSIINKRELLKTRHSDLTMRSATPKPLLPARANSESHIFRNIPAYVRRAWQDMSTESPEENAVVREKKRDETVSTDAFGPSRRHSLCASASTRPPLALGATPRRNSASGVMTYVEEREAVLRSLRATSLAAKETILQRVSIANCLNFREIKNRSNIFSKKAISLISTDKTADLKIPPHCPKIQNTETLVEKVTRTFPLHMMMTTEDAIYGLSHSLNVARRNQQLLDEEKRQNLESPIPDPRFSKLELALLKINDQQPTKAALNER